MAKGIDRSAIVSAAFDVLTEKGLDGLTVRAVAGRLEIKAATLYWHIRDKKDLLDEMSTELWRRILADLPVRDNTTWHEQLRNFAVAMRHTLLGVRDGARVFGGAYLTDTSLFDTQEHTMALLVSDGFTPHNAMLGWSLVYSFTLGLCIEEQEVRQRLPNRYALEARDVRVDAVHHPLVAAAGREAFTAFDHTFAELIDQIMITIHGLRAAC